jgi:glutamine amidotransferase
MCRQLAYVGPPIPLESLLIEPAHSLLHQSYQPKTQRHGVVNADGFGVGWFDTDKRTEPAIYRRAAPVWSDRSFLSMAGLIRSKAFLAAVRDATTGSFVEESSTAPFGQQGWLFAHNGMFRNFDGPPGVWLRRTVSDRRLAAIRGTSDSEFLFALILDRMDAGATVRDAMTSVIADCLGRTTGAFNFLLHDGWRITATACGDSLCYLEGSDRLPGGVVIASEPYDDDPAWRQVPDGSVVEGYCGGVTVSPMRTGS